jgi:multisubunit Na+/H+ antiporter MnhE subunit
VTRIGFTILLAGIYVAMLGSIAPLDLLAGVVFGAVVAASCARRPRTPLAAWRDRIAAWPRALGVFARELVDGARTMLRVLLGRQPWRHAGVVEVSIASMGEREAVIAAWIVTVSPGGVLLAIDSERRVMTFHVIDARDPAQFRREVTNLPPWARQPAPGHS